MTLRVPADYSSRVPADLSGVSPTSSSAPAERPLQLAVLLVGLAGAGLTAVGLGAMLQFHGRFSLGVGLMLVLYGLGVMAAAWLGYKRHLLAFGAMVSVTLLHIAVVASTARGSRATWLWWFEIPLVVTLVCLLVPSSLRALGRLPRTED